MLITAVKESHFRLGAVAMWAVRLDSSWWHQACVSRPHRELKNQPQSVLPGDWTYFGGKAALLFSPSSSSPSPFNDRRQLFPQTICLPYTSISVNLHFFSFYRLLILSTRSGRWDGALDLQLLTFTRLWFLPCVSP